MFLLSFFGLFTGIGNITPEPTPTYVKVIFALAFVILFLIAIILSLVLPHDNKNARSKIKLFISLEEKEILESHSQKFDSGNLELFVRRSIAETIKRDNELVNAQTHSNATKTSSPLKEVNGMRFSEVNGEKTYYYNTEK